MHARYDRVSLTAVFNTLCVRVAEDIDRKGYVGRTIGIKLRYADFSLMTRGKTLLNPTTDPLTIRRAAGEFLQRIPLKQRLTLPVWKSTRRKSRHRCATCSPTTACINTPRII